MTILTWYQKKIWNHIWLTQKSKEMKPFWTICMISQNVSLKGTLFQNDSDCQIINCNSFKEFQNVFCLHTKKMSFRGPSLIYVSRNNDSVANFWNVMAILVCHFFMVKTLHFGYSKAPWFDLAISTFLDWVGNLDMILTNYCSGPAWNKC